MAIANDSDDPGRGGYGPWQLSTNWGMDAFLESPWGRRFLLDFGGSTPGTQTFNVRYKRVASRDPAGFRRAQHAFIHNTLYQPVAEHAAAKGFDLDNQGIREAIWSMAVQHGGAKSIIDRVVEAKAQRGDPNKVITEIYKHRMDYVVGLNALSLEQKKANVERYKKEGRQLLIHDALARRQNLSNQTLIDVSNPRNYHPPRYEIPD